MSDAPRLLDGRYRLGRRLGRGGMSEVYRAVDTRLDRPVAVKVFRSNADREARQRFSEEARLLGRLSHPGLVAVHDAGSGGQDGEPYLVMQLVEGRSLAEVIKAGALAPEQVTELGIRLAQVLAHVHANGIVHRDIKPANVLITEDGRVFLADFGISRLVDAVGRLTDTGIVMGSAHYLSPEQVRDEEFGFPADIYALGLVLLEALTGRTEYDGTKAEAAVARLVRAPHIPAEAPEPLAGTLRAMTAAEAGDRPPAVSCARMLAGEIAPPAEPETEQIPAPEPEAGERPAPEPESRPRRRFPLLASTAAVALVVLAAVLLVPQRVGGDVPQLPPPAGPAGVHRLPQDLANLAGLVRE